MLLRISFLIIFCSHFPHVFAQVNVDGFSDEPRGKNELRLVFYNVENLFDTINDPTTNDNEYTASGKRNWVDWKYQVKLNNIAKVIIATGGWEAPEIIGLCEIENRKVLEDLLTQPPLKQYNYKIIHQDSPDNRGIDVAILYRNKKVQLEEWKAIPVVFPEKNRPTRDILRAKFIWNKKDTLHYFVNHWPSRYGGKEKTEPKRINAATVLRGVVDSIITFDSLANLVICGDFNDHPEDSSVNVVLGAKTNSLELQNNDLVNVLSLQKNETGTHKYRGHWGILDMFIVSQNLFDKSTSPCIESALIFNAEFLLEKEKKYLGYKPKRTFKGYTFQSGYSDHLPIILDVKAQ